MAKRCLLSVMYNATGILVNCHMPIKCHKWLKKTKNQTNHRILNPLSKARDRTCVLTDTSQIHLR